MEAPNALPLHPIHTLFAALYFCGEIQDTDPPTEVEVKARCPETREPRQAILRIDPNDDVVTAQLSFV